MFKFLCSLFLCYLIFTYMTGFMHWTIWPLFAFYCVLLILEKMR